LAGAFFCTQPCPSLRLGWVVAVVVVVTVVAVVTVVVVVAVVAVVTVVAVVAVVTVVAVVAVVVVVANVGGKTGLTFGKEYIDNATIFMTF
jgi:hypothetical protein